MSRRLLTLPTWLSPILLAYVLIETLINEAYPSDADSIAIPWVLYLFFCYPIAVFLTLHIKTQHLSPPEITLWNPHRHVLSLFSLILSVYPLGVFWFYFVEVSVHSRSYGSTVVCSIMLAVTVAARTYAIQDQTDVEQSAAGGGSATPEP